MESNEVIAFEGKLRYYVLANINSEAFYEDEYALGLSTFLDPVKKLIALICPALTVLESNPDLHELLAIAAKTFVHQYADDPRQVEFAGIATIIVFKGSIELCVENS